MADVKFSELDNLTAADSGDIFAVVDTSASTSKKLSIDNLFGTVPVDVRVTDATDTSSATTGSLRTAGGIAAEKALTVGTTSTLTGAVTATAGVFPAASDTDAASAKPWKELQPMPIRCALEEKGFPSVQTSAILCCPVPFRPT